MRFGTLLVITGLCAFAAAPGQDRTNDFEQLTAYQGTWQVSRAGARKPDTLINKCATLGQFFLCAQNVNGQPGELMIFLRHGDPGHYQVQTIMPTGRATGLTGLGIAGNTWTYSNRQDQNGATTYYKTINVFSGKDKIHFESSHSTNGKDFTVDAKGDEVKVAK